VNDDLGYLSQPRPTTTTARRANDRSLPTETQGN
jgi:hypothetical protein